MFPRELNFTIIISVVCKTEWNSKKKKKKMSPLSHEVKSNEKEMFVFASFLPRLSACCITQVRHNKTQVESHS